MKVYVKDFKEGDTRTFVGGNKAGETEKFSGAGWVKYDVDAELVESLHHTREERR